MIHEKRRHRRFTLDLIELKGKLNLDDSVEIIDISFGGVALTVERRLNIGQECLFRLRDKRNSIDVRGVVVRSRLTGTKQRNSDDRVSIYSAGMRFTVGSADKIAAFIRNAIAA